MFISSVTLGTFALLSLSLAHPQPPGIDIHFSPAPVESTITTRCYTTVATTEWDQRPGTAWQTWPTTCETTLTKTVTATTTAPASTTTTITTVTTTTTGPATTDTATATSTVSATTTLTLTASDTTTTTSTTTTSTTTTIPASSGFVPIQSSLPNSADVKRRGLSMGRSANVGVGLGGSGWQRFPPVAGTNHYPQNVKCTAYVGTCTTISITLTVTATVTPTVSTTTSTSTITATSIPTALTTTTVTTTSTDTITTTSTTTTTDTDVVTATSTISFYAACATNNMVDQYEGSSIYGYFYSDPSDTFTTTDDTDAYDCCVSAMNNDIGALYAFDGVCYIEERPACVPVSQEPAYTPDTNAEGRPVATLGNAYCGEVVPS